jgi:hypothetical protein
MKTLFRREFGHPKLMIGMVHTPPLPGAPGYDRAGGMRPIVERARADAGTLQDAGFHAVMFSNEFDMPYEMTMRRETIAAMTAVVMEARPQLRVPYGVNMLIDPAASVAIAHATGARFVRAYLTGAFAGDFGLWQGRGAEVQRLKAAIGAGVLVIANATPGFSDSLDRRSLAAIAYGAVVNGLADAVCVSGSIAGVPTDPASLRVAAEAVPDTPVVAGTGVTEENVGRLVRCCDGVIIGTWLKVDGDIRNPVDPGRARRFMAAVAAHTTVDAG